LAVSSGRLVTPTFAKIALTWSRELAVAVDHNRMDVTAARDFDN
jgi:hypothetical protein